MEPEAGSWCGTTEVCFRLRDQERRLTSVRLESAVVRGDLAYREDTGTWELRLPRPPVHRIEYKLALGHADGGPDTSDDAVLCCPDYREPEWVHLPGAAGQELAEVEAVAVGHAGEGTGGPRRRPGSVGG